MQPGDDGYEPPGCQNTTDRPSCFFEPGRGCGNGRADDCVYPILAGDSFPSNCSTTHYKEICDGDDIPAPASCVAGGYLGGDMSCKNCRLDYSSCSTCIVGGAVATCQDIDAPAAIVPDASGQAIAIGGAIYQPMSGMFELVTTTTLGWATWIGVTNGWLAFTHDASGLAVRTVSLTGTLGTPRTIAANDVVPFAAYESGGHVLVAWTEAVAPSGARVLASIVDSTGAQVTAPAVVIDVADADTNLSLASDGNSFFLLDGTRLLRMNSSGNVIGTNTVTAAVLGERLTIVANGNARWLVRANATSTFVRSVALDGTFAGAEQSVLLSGPLTAFTPYGNDLLALAQMTRTFDLTRLGVDGSFSTPVTIGMGRARHSPCSARRPSRRGRARASAISRRSLRSQRRAGCTHARLPSSRMITARR